MLYALTVAQMLCPLIRFNPLDLEFRVVLLRLKSVAQETHSVNLQSIRKNYQK